MYVFQLRPCYKAEELVHNFYTASLTSHLLSLRKLSASWNRVTTDSIQQNSNNKIKGGGFTHICNQNKVDTHHDSENMNPEVGGY